MKRTAKWVLLLVVLLPILLFVILRVTAIPVRAVDHAAFEPRIIIVSEHPKSRLSVWRARLDHLVSPVPELSDSRVIRFGAVIRDSAQNEYLALSPSVSDCFVVYRCGPNNELLWKGYFSMSP